MSRFGVSTRRAEKWWRTGGPRRPARLRDFDAERLGRLQVDDELESDRQTGPASRPVSRP